MEKMGQKSEIRNELRSTSIRGLEEASPKRTAKRQLFVKSILDHQRELSDQGLKDPKGIRAISRTMSRRDREMASKLGVADKDEAKRIWENNSDGNESMDTDYYLLTRCLLDKSTQSAYKNVNLALKECEVSSNYSHAIQIQFFKKGTPPMKKTSVSSKAA